MTFVATFLKSMIVIKFLSRLKSLLILLVLSLNSVNSTNVNQLDFDKSREHYTKLQGDENQRLEFFKKHFKEALSSPENLAHICPFYTDGLMVHVGYSELGPSFCAYVDLHQGLFRATQNIDIQSILIPQKIRDDFEETSKIFFDNVEKLFLIKSIEKFEENLNKIYKEFLIKFIRTHYNFFKARWLAHLNEIKEDQPYALDIIDRAFFALQEDWSSYETHEAKYQFEKLYVYGFENNHLLIVGYNDRPHACDRFLKIYHWNFETGAPDLIKKDNVVFDLSPWPYAGGCSHEVNPLNVIVKRKDSIQFQGFDNTIFRKYYYSPHNKTWQIESWECNEINNKG